MTSNLFEEIFTKQEAIKSLLTIYEFCKYNLKDNIEDVINYVGELNYNFLIDKNYIEENEGVIKVTDAGYDFLDMNGSLSKQHNNTDIHTLNKQQVHY
jgi:hypothetical protein